jgi:hypothetical protein
MPEKTIKRRLKDCDAALDIRPPAANRPEARYESAYLRVF